MHYRNSALLIGLLFALYGSAEAQQQTGPYIQVSPTPSKLSVGGPGFVQVDANGIASVVAQAPGSGTVTNTSGALAANSMVVGNSGSDIKTVGGSIGGTFTTAGNVSLTGAGLGLTLAFPANGPFTYTFPLATSTLASLAGSETFTNKIYSGGQLSGTFNGNPTFTGVPLFTSLSAGTQIACLGLDAGFHLVTLNASCGAGGGGLTVGTTAIASGTTNRILYDNAGVVGELIIGPGLINNSGTLQSTASGSIPVNDQTAHTTYTVLTSDQGKLVTFCMTDGSAIAVTLPQAGTTGFAANWGTTLLNLEKNASGVACTGTVTVTPTTSKVNGSTTQTLAAGTAYSPISDATNYYGPLTVDTGGGSGTVNSGTANHLAYYASSTTAVSSEANMTVSAGALSLGASGTAGSVAMGNATSGTVTVQPVTGALGSSTLSLPALTKTLTATIFSGAKALATGAISSAACTSAQTDTATGTLTTDVVLASFNGDPTAVTGYVPLTTGMLTIIAYPTADTVNFKVCNNTSGSITPGAITLNWRVVR